MGWDRAQQSSAATLLVPKLPGLSFSSARTELVQDEATGLTKAVEQRTVLNPQTAYMAAGEQVTQGSYLPGVPMQNISVADVLSPLLMGPAAQAVGQASSYQQQQTQWQQQQQQQQQWQQQQQGMRLPNSQAAPIVEVLPGAVDGDSAVRSNSMPQYEADQAAASLLPQAGLGPGPSSQQQHDNGAARPAAAAAAAAEQPVWSFHST
ncbi:hypothetical protein OEZ86_006378 [Tetradesmus obliquus]|nr:hypothetical protein OEZ86_006378 [Tetradesmus obliquus]